MTRFSPVRCVRFVKNSSAGAAASWRKGLLLFTLMMSHNEHEPNAACCSGSLIFLSVEIRDYWILMESGDDGGFRQGVKPSKSPQLQGLSAGSARRWRHVPGQDRVSTSRAAAHFLAAACTKRDGGWQLHATRHRSDWLVKSAAFCKCRDGLSRALHHLQDVDLHKSGDKCV